MLCNMQITKKKLQDYLTRLQELKAEAFSSILSGESPEDEPMSVFDFLSDSNNSSGQTPEDEF